MSFQVIVFQQLLIRLLFSLNLVATLHIYIQFANFPKRYSDTEKALFYNIASKFPPSLIINN